MTEDEIVKVYIDHIARWFGIKPTRQIADELDLSESQVESIMDDISWPKFKIAQNVKKASAEDLKPACVIIPFRGKIEP